MQIYLTPIRKIPIQLNELWKHAALPMKHAHSETEKGPHVLNINNVKQTSKHKEFSETRKQQLWNQTNSNKLHSNYRKFLVNYTKLKKMHPQTHHQEVWSISPI